MGVVLALVSSLMWGTADFFGGTLSRRLPAMAVVLGSQVCAGVLIIAVAIATHSWGGSLAYLPWGIAAGVTGLTALILFYAALASGTMGIVSPIAALGVLVPLSVGLLTGQLPSGGQYLGIALALVGIVLASGPELSGAASAKPVFMAIASAVGFGVCLAFIAEGSKTNVIMTMTTMRSVSIAVAVVAVVALRSTGGIKRRDLPMLAMVGGMDVFANVAYGAATQMALLPVVAMLGCIYPVVTVLLAWRLLHERLARVQYAGVAVALLGVALISVFGAL